MNLKDNEFFRFILAGGAGFLTTFVLTFLLTEYAGWWYGLSYVVSAVVGCVVIFILNSWFTFGSQGNLWSRAAAFAVTYLSSYAINVLIVLVLTEGLGVYYLLSIMMGTAVVMLINYFVSKHFIFVDGVHPLVARIKNIVKNHWAAFVLAFIAALIVFTPNVLLWTEQEYQGIEIMMLDAENHYFARVHQVYEGDISIHDTFVPGDAPYATPPLGENLIAFFGKLFGLNAARAAVISKPFSVAAIFLLIYAFAFALSRSKRAALLAAAVPLFGYSLIAFSPQPFIDLFTNHSTAGPFIFFSRLVNPSIAALFLFGALLLMYHVFEKRVLSLPFTVLLGVLVGLPVYISPFTFTFLGALLFLIWLWFVSKKDPVHWHILYAGILALLLVIPFILNTVALNQLPAYEHLARFIGLVHKREVVMGFLLPLIAAAVAFFWPRTFQHAAKTFLLLAALALALVLNQQIITGTTLQVSHYHWYITKPLAGIVAGLFAGFLIERYLNVRLRRVAMLLILGCLIYNTLGFFAPWYKEARVSMLSEQRYGPLVHYLNTLPEQQVIWASPEASDFIPIYSNHAAPNSVNLGSYPLSQQYFDDRLFLDYRLQGVTAKEFETLVREDANHVSGWLWGVWLRELTGNPTAIPEEEYQRLIEAYAGFTNQPFRGAFDALGISMLVVEDKKDYSFTGLHLATTTGTFSIYER